ncbi:hypothetical protein P7K49_009971 [Saguinus oedipus]|uniref:Z-binding domain-containing protein n=1 Tax=Saguinus oedipus TaxID=9490 RepID=A0ABQ9VLH0_SAGOE|nr:hypothetical protein P7K49_009971 [Saguinus oedipus]
MSSLQSCTKHQAQLHENPSLDPAHSLKARAQEPAPPGKSLPLPAAVIGMAQASADPGKEGHLEQRILQVLMEAGSPVKLAQLVKECQVPKKELNQVLYRMKTELKVSLTAPATWCLGGASPDGKGPAELAIPSPGNCRPGGRSDTAGTILAMDKCSFEPGFESELCHVGAHGFPLCALVSFSDWGSSQRGCMPRGPYKT